jgi:hypothetical protein
MVEIVVMKTGMVPKLALWFTRVFAICLLIME